MYRRWWERARIDLEGAKKLAAETTTKSNVFGGGFGRGIERGLKKIGGVSESDRVKWSGMEQGGGRMSDQPRQTTGR